jgi:hypothetical protein
VLEYRNNKMKRRQDSASRKCKLTRAVESKTGVGFEQVQQVFLQHGRANRFPMRFPLKA